MEQLWRVSRVSLSADSMQVTNTCRYQPKGGKGGKGKGRREEGEMCSNLTISPNLGWRLDGRKRARKGGKKQGR